MNTIRFNEAAFRNKMVNNATSDMRKVFNYMNYATGKCHFFGIIIHNEYEPKLTLGVGSSKIKGMN